MLLEMRLATNRVCALQIYAEAEDFRDVIRYHLIEVSS
jgi:hypothetical protein